MCDINFWGEPKTEETIPNDFNAVWDVLVSPIFVVLYDHDEYCDGTNRVRHLMGQYWIVKITTDNGFLLIPPTYRFEIHEGTEVKSWQLQPE